MSMIHLLMLAVHLLATIANLLRPGELRRPKKSWNFSTIWSFEQWQGGQQPQSEAQQRDHRCRRYAIPSSAQYG